jgi:hypothetical protein
MVRISLRRDGASQADGVCIGNVLTVHLSPDMGRDRAALPADDQPAQNTRALYNVCPTTPIDTIVGHNDKRALVPMRWAWSVLVGEAVEGVAPRHLQRPRRRSFDNNYFSLLRFTLCGNPRCQ